MTILTGIVYPLIVYLFGILVFPDKASGRLLYRDNKVIGSALIAQKFESDRYFWSRPSAVDYNALASGGSNLSQTSKKLKNLVSKRKEKYNAEVPVEMLFASGSGLDPHISVAAANYQVERIEKNRNLKREKIVELIKKNTHGIFDATYVNVLQLNIALDELK